MTQLQTGGSMRTEEEPLESPSAGDRKWSVQPDTWRETSHAEGSALAGRWDTEPSVRSPAAGAGVAPAVSFLAHFEAIHKKYVWWIYM